MRVVFESGIEKSNVIATVTRLIREINERSHSTAEEMNLEKTLLILKSTPTAEEYTYYAKT